MTKAGTKMIAAMEEAAKAAKCRHKWERMVTRVRNSMVTGSMDECGKCGVKRHTWTAKVPARS